MAFDLANVLVRDPAEWGSASAGASATRVARLQVMALSVLPDQSWFDEVAADAALLEVSGLGSDDTLEWASTTAQSPADSHRPPLSALRDAHLAVASTGRAEDLKHLLELSLDAPTAVERAVSAQILSVLSRGRHDRGRAVLEQARFSASSEARAIAALAASPERDDADVMGPARPSDGTPALEPARLSTTVSGTWARLAPDAWFVPGAPLHGHILGHASPDLYAGERYFLWTSAYNDEDRRQGGAQLIEWAIEHCGAASLDTVYAHSHGGNVALSAAAQGLRIQMLVLLHVPPRRRKRSEWDTIRRNVARTAVYRVRLDRVVLADMLRVAAGPKRALGQRFDKTLLPHVDSEPHPIDGPWFDHGFYTDVENWRERRVADDVAYWRRRPRMR